MNSVTACSEAATALPGSTERVSTTPSIGERIEARPRLVSSVLSVARACATAAWALACSAIALSSAARALSISAGAGTWPPDRRCTSSSRARLARASLAAAAACATPACAAARLARVRVIWSSSLAVSSSTSTWPFLTRSFTSTRTRATMPDSSLPMLTERVGWILPLAVTLSARSPRASGSVV